MAHPKTRAYVDTSALLMILGYRQFRVDYPDAANRLRYVHDLKIPQIVLGETLSIIHDMTRYKTKTKYKAHAIDLRDSALGNLNDLISKLPDCLSPTTSKIISTADYIHDHDYKITDTDSLILSHALCDNDAVYFFTTDKILSSDWVLGYISELKRTGKRDKTLNISIEFMQ